MDIGLRSFNCPIKETKRADKTSKFWRTFFSLSFLLSLEWLFLPSNKPWTKIIQVENKNVSDSSFYKLDRSLIRLLKFRFNRSYNQGKEDWPNCLSICRLKYLCAANILAIQPRKETLWTFKKVMRCLTWCFSLPASFLGYWKKFLEELKKNVNFKWQICN